MRIFQTVSEKFQFPHYQSVVVVPDNSEIAEIAKTPSEKLINDLSFSHLVELLKLEESVKRMFYKTMAISNNWSVRELQRAINSMLYERTGLVKTKRECLKVTEQVLELTLKISILLLNLLFLVNNF